MEESPWSLIRAGRYAESIAASTRDIERNPRSVIGYNNRGVAHLLLRHYAEAGADFRHVIALPPAGEGGYIKYGATQWFQGLYAEAITTWTSGVGVSYTDAAGGVELPLLLFYAAVRLNHQALRRDARRLLMRAARRKVIHAWPGPLALYLTGKCTADELRQAAKTIASALTARHECQAAFYEGVYSLHQQQEEVFQVKLRECIDAPDSAVFLEIEYFIARWELEQQFHIPSSRPDTVSPTPETA